MSRGTDPHGDGGGALTGTPYRRALVIANPISGRGQGAKAAQELEEGLNRLGVPTELFRTGKRGDAFTRLRTMEPGIDLVVAAGGDGTVREVFEGLVDPEVPVGILPFGTANVLATELGLPRDVHHALEIIAAHRVSPIDVATVNGRMSFLVTGIGIDGMAVRQVEEKRTGPITKWSYVEAVLRTLRGYEPPRITVELDSERLEGEYGLVLVSNTIGYGGLLNLSEDTRRDDGLFEVYLFPTGRIGELLGAFVRGLVSSLPGGAVEMRRARTVRIDSEKPVPYQVDGDFGGETPVEIEVGRTQYRILVP
ncbi:MAG: diacylglycerol kinase family lipid kinase [Planctomycetota bacterium]|nr:diacylglycerol kinase family lipid kinase [Planctomycetota bacterium]